MQFNGTSGSGGPVGDAAGEARVALGLELRERRLLAGLAQRELAGMVRYARASVANAERGDLPARSFWEACDAVLEANGALVSVYDDAAGLRRRQVAEAARRARIERCARWAPETAPGAAGVPVEPVGSAAGERAEVAALVRQVERLTAQLAAVSARLPELTR